MLPILHLNGYKISNPTVLARIEHEELDQFLRGCGWEPRYVEGDDPEDMHELMATVLDETVEAHSPASSATLEPPATPPAGGGR